MENTFLLFLGAITLIFIWVIWLRQVLVHHLTNMQNRKELLMRDLWRRRDIVPYLLESFRSQEDLKETWLQILDARKLFHGPYTLEQEWEFEQLLMQFLQNSKVTNLNFLEAKKDIEDLTTIIEEKKKNWQKAVHDFSETRNRFPYSLASGIFGFRKIQA